MIRIKRLTLLVVLIAACISSLFSMIVYAADNTELIQAKSDVEAVIATQGASSVEDPYYEPNSYQVFYDTIDGLGGVVGIQAVIDDPAALQADVDLLVSQINTALDGLIMNDTYETASSLLNNAKTLDVSTYTPNSVIIYNLEISRIENILNDSSAGEVAIQQIIVDLNLASSLLVLQADKTNLILLRDRLIEVYYEERTRYTETSHDMFRDEVDDFGSYLYVNSVINDLNVSQNDVDQLVVTIENALDLLVLRVDNTNLLTVYYQLMDEDLSEYTLDSRDNYYEELDRLYQLIVGNELDASLATEVLFDLSEINGLLVSLADYTSLQTVYDNSLNYREEDYSVTSYAYFNEAKESALAMLNNLNASQQQIDDTIIALQVATDALEQKLETIYVIEENRVDLNDYIVLGNATIIEFRVEDSSVITINSQGIATGLAYGKTKAFVELSNGAIEEIDIMVKAKVTTTVMVLTFTIPVVTLGLGALLIFSKKESWVKLAIRVKKIFKKK